jgi:YD repeat-containing protein
MQNVDTLGATIWRRIDKMGRAAVRLCALASVLTAMSGPANAQTLTTYFDELKPELQAYLLTGLPVGWYGTVDEAFAAYSAWFTGQTATSSMTYEVWGLHACANQHDYYWGTPTSWCWYERITYKGSNALFREGLAGSIELSDDCPAGPPFYSKVGNLVAGSDSNLPRYHERRCVRTALPIAPNSCGRGNPIYPDSGTKRQTERDYASANGALTFTRHYHSAIGRFRHEYDIDFVPPNRKVSASCVAGTLRLLGNVQRCFQRLNASLTGDKAVFIGADGARDEIAWSGGIGVSTAPYFKSRLVDQAVNGAPGWLMTQPQEGRLLAFDDAGRLQFVQHISGKRIDLTYAARTLSAISDDRGRSLQIAHGLDGLVTVTDPAGQVLSYAYTDLNKMDSVTYQDGSGKSYLWDEPAWVTLTASYSPVNLLTGIVDELGQRFASFGYRWDGVTTKATSTQHVGAVEHFAIADNRSAGVGSIVLTDPLGSVTNISYAVINGLSRQVSNTQPAGNGCAASTSAMSYDTNGNVAVEDDFNGNRICRSHDLTRNRESVRVQGLPTTQACSAVTAANAALPAGSRKVSTQWHPDWRLAVKVAEPGRITTSVYNGQPDPFAGNSIASCAPSAALLPDGKPIAVLCKTVEHATTDANGSLGFGAALQSGVANRMRQWSYNQHGQVLTAKDALNNTTTYTYHTATTADVTMGDLATMSNAKGQLTNYTKYNRHGQLLESSDPNGVVTVNTYDLRQRLLSTSVGGQTTSYTYDPAGQLTRMTRPDASWIGYEYDAAHRQVAVLDNRGNRIDYTLDNAGNKTGQAVKDPGGALRRTLARSIDALGRIQQTTGRE